MDDIDLNKPRKRRAIGYLAKRILERLPDEVKDNERWEMTMDQICQTFDASRGLVYEVFHVFEALVLVTKIGKNAFLWNGFTNMTQTLAFLRYIGLCQNFHHSITMTREKEASGLVEENRSSFHDKLKNTHPNMIQEWMEEQSAVKSLMPIPETVSSFNPPEIPPPEINPDVVVAQQETVATTRKPEHILTVIQKFIILFLVADEPKTMSLTFVSKVIHGTDIPASYQKARTR